MTLNERIETLQQLGQLLSNKDEYLEAVMKRTEFNNQWFTLENQQLAVKAIAENFLQKDKLENWLNNYNITDPSAPKKVGIVMAGNIPMVGFHDLLCVFAAGHHALIKLSDKDKFTLPYLIKLLEKINPASKGYFTITEKIGGFDAVIATGSNNSARYFESYFGKFPNIIRKNRNGVAVLDGSESIAEMLALGTDIFQYFGLGCRNVSKIYVPKNYEFKPLLEALHEYKELVLNNKYKNNFDYNFALLQLNKVSFHINGCLILTESTDIASRIATLHYEFYEDIEHLEKQLDTQMHEIQCIVAKEHLLNLKTFPFGMAQKPSLEDYADGVDTMRFLCEI